MRNTARAAVVSLLGAFVAMSGIAQETDLEIVVTASRIEEDINDVAASVSVITAEDLAASGQTTLVDALKNLAGVSFRSFTSNPTKTQVAMRGFGENSQGRVLVLLNGRRINSPDLSGVNWLQVPVESVDRIEVVRGAGSVLYGDNAVAGVINIITKSGGELTGDQGFDVSVSGQYGSYGLNQERVGISGSTGAVTYALNAERTAGDGYRDRSAFTTMGGGADLEIELGALAIASVTANYQASDYELPGGLTRNDWETDPTQAANPDDEASDQFLNAAVRVSAAVLPNLEISTDVSYGWTQAIADYPSFIFGKGFSDQSIRTVALTPKAVLKTDLAGLSNRLTVGADLYWEQLEKQVYDDLARTIQAVDVTLVKKSGGLYAADDLAVTDQLTLGVGGRVELASFKVDATIPSDLTEDKLHRGIAFELSALYRFSEGSRFYTRLDRVYRYPATDEQVVYSGWGPNEFLADLDAEKGYQMEAGGRLEIDEALSFGTSAYLLLMEDEIAFSGVKNENLDKTQHLGAEADLSYQIVPMVTFTGHYSFVQATFRDGPNKNNEVPLVPNHQLRGEVSLGLPVGVTVVVNADYVSQSYQGGDTDNETEDKIPSYYLMGVSARYDPDYVPGDLELFVGLENILDADYLSWIYYDGYYPSPGFSWKIGASYRY